MRISDWSSDVCSSDLFEHEVEASLVECLDIDDPPDATDIVERGRLAILFAGKLAWLDHPDLPVAREHLLHHRRRSEEHTSELQSLMRISYAVFCLKKKK